MKKLLNVFAFTLVFVFVVTTLIRGNVNAQTPPEENVVVKMYDDRYDLNKLETESDNADIHKQTGIGKVASVLENNLTMFGPDLVSDLSEAKIKLLAEKPYLRYGLVQGATQTMVYSFFMAPSANIPQQYAQMLLPKELVEKAGTAYAETYPPDAASSRQFMGYLGLNKLWGVSFSLAMAVLVIILIIAGFMIMFRSKAGGQVVVTVSMALQNAVIGAVLALASYALGAFFINLSKYLVLMIGVLFQSYVFANSDVKVIYLNGPWNMFEVFWGSMAWGSFSNDWSTWYKAASDGAAQGYKAYLNDPSAGTYLNSLWTLWKSASSIVGFSIISVIAKLIIGAAMLVAAIRIFWTVLSTYIKMIIDIIIAPILFMVSSLPGKQSGFSTWIQRMFKNAIAIPIMFAFVNVAAYMAFVVSVSTETCATDNRSILTCVTGGLIPGGVTGGTDWLIMSVGPSAIIALVLLNMVPSVPTMVNEMFNAKGGDFSKVWDGTKKSLQGVPVVGGLFQ